MIDTIFTVDPSCAGAYPGFKIGILALANIENGKAPDQLQKIKAEVTANIRQNFTGLTREQLNEIPTIASYNAYYAQFGKTYHVRAQVESIASGKPLPDVSGILDAMFTAEAKSMLLTAGHDLDTLELPVHLAVATQEESYEGMKGAPRKTYVHDLVMRDSKGVISTIISGPDDRSKITPSTHRAMFAVYAPPEIPAEAVEHHLLDIQNSIATFSPNLETLALHTFVLG